MESLLLAARLVLAAALALAAAAKLADRAGAVAGARDLGLPAPLAQPAALALPALELAAACLLLPAATATAGSALALALLVLFSAALTKALVEGHEVDCRCFGQLSAAPAGPRALARNALLAGLAALALGGGVASAGPDATPALAGLAAVPVALAALRRRQVAPPPPAPPPRPEAPAFSLPSREGDPTSLEDLLVGGRPVLLVFLQDRPSPALAARLAELQRYSSHALTLAVVASRLQAVPAEVERALLDSAGETRRAFGVEQAPGAALVSADGLLVAVEEGEAAVERLAARSPALEQEAVERWLDVETSLHRLELVDGAGRRVPLAALAGEETVLLLWRPGCRPCRDLYERLRAWERRRPPGAPRLAVVSLGGPADAVDRFASPTFYDPDLELVEALSGGHAPAALRLDAQGQASSRLALGAEAVLSLLQP